MSVGGRKPDVIAGALHSSHSNKPAPHPSAAGGTITSLDTPDELSPSGRIVWEMATGDLVRSGVLQRADLPLLVEMVECLAMARDLRIELQSALRDDPASQETKRLRSAYIQMVQAAGKLAGDFGVGPVARIRLGLAKVQGASLMAALTDGNE